MKNSPIERARKAVATVKSGYGSAVCHISHDDLRCLIAVVEAANRMPDRVACDARGAGSYLDEFVRLEATTNVAMGYPNTLPGFDAP